MVTTQGGSTTEISRWPLLHKAYIRLIQKKKSLIHGSIGEAATEISQNETWQHVQHGVPNPTSHPRDTLHSQEPLFDSPLLASKNCRTLAGIGRASKP